MLWVKQDYYSTRDRSLCNSRDLFWDPLDTQFFLNSQSFLRSSLCYWPDQLEEGSFESYLFADSPWANWCGYVCFSSCFKVDLISAFPCAKYCLWLAVKYLSREPEGPVEVMSPEHFRLIREERCSVNSGCIINQTFLWSSCLSWLCLLLLLGLPGFAHEKSLDCLLHPPGPVATDYPEANSRGLSLVCGVALGLGVSPHGLPGEGGSVFCSPKRVGPSSTKSLRSS